MSEPEIKPLDPRRAIQGFLLLDGTIRLCIWGGAATVTMYLMSLLGAWPSIDPRGSTLWQAWVWGWAMLLAMVLFNVAYVLLLIVLRAPIPTPREGKYRLVPGRRPDRQLVWSSLIATLTKAYYEAPFPAFLAYHYASVPPICWLFNRIFGPRNQSTNFTAPLFADPRLIEVGRNVVFGYRASVTAHQQGRDEIEIARVVIEDDVMVGGNVLIYAGCTIKRGAVILGGAIVRPHTVIGENEVWGGVPAVKIKTIAAFGGGASATA